MPTSVQDIFERHGPMVYRLALRILGNRADAEDATQEIFVRLASAPALSAHAKNLTAWLYTISSNYCLNQLRNRARRAALLKEHPGPQPAPADAPDELTLLRQLLAACEEQQALAAIYVFLDGMSHDEAAALLGVSRRTVGNLLERFREAAARRLADGRPAPSQGPSQDPKSTPGTK